LRDSKTLGCDFESVYTSSMQNFPLRGAIAFAIPVVLVFAVSAVHPQGYYFLAAGPLCGIVGGLAFGRVQPKRDSAQPQKTWGLAIVLGLCFGIVGFMFNLQEARSALFTDVVWTGFVSAFLFWVAGGCAVLTLPPEKRFNAAAALAIPGAIAGMAFQFFWGPAHFLFDLGSRKWWGGSPWEHFIFWLIAGVGGGWLLARNVSSKQAAEFRSTNRWASVSIVCGLFGLATGALYFLRSALPLGLFNSLSPASAAADWLWGWGVLAAGIGLLALLKPHRRLWAAGGVALAILLAFTSFRVEANPWKSQFNSKYAENLLRDQPGSGDAIYAGNLILAQVALDKNDIENAKRYLLEAAGTSGARRIEQNGLDVSVARILFDRGEKDTVLEYLRRGRVLWPQGTQLIGRWESAIRAGRRPNFNTRGPGGGQGNFQDR
jgi:hypothetical protein